VSGPGTPEELAHYRLCLGCGPDNPESMRLRTWFEGDRVHGRVTLEERHTGAPGFAHGGAVATLMDDMLGTVPLLLGRMCVTATLTLDYRAPVLLGHELSLVAWCERVDGRKLYLRGEIRDGEKLCAEGHGMFLEVPAVHWEAAGRPLPDDWLGSATHVGP
jgi:acyl-coenzyme A thioesterase PaaI-like protein